MYPCRIQTLDAEFGTISSRQNLIAKELQLHKALLHCHELHAGTSEEGVVSLYNEEVGMWEYNVSGVGLRPGIMEATRIAATLGSDGSSFVSWRNPFVEALKVPSPP